MSHLYNTKLTRIVGNDLLFAPIMVLTINQFWHILVAI